MFEPSNLDECLLNGNNNFGIDRNDIKKILEPKNIINKKSHKIIENLGGIKSLCDRLSVDQKNFMIE